MQNEEVVREFFLAYQEHAYPRMQALLQPDVRFKDFAFNIEGQRVFAMWQWFCTRSDPVEVPWFGNIRANGEDVTADYRVAYPYGAARRPVDYVIHSRFVLEDGRIAQHHDEGDIRVWSRQALGRPAAACSWSLVFKCIIQWQAQNKLDAFMEHQDFGPREGR